MLDAKLQAGKSYNKWNDQTRVGIFLCHSPEHAGNVPLILNTQSGNVSPQFHSIYDDDFATCEKDAKFESLWQYKAKLYQRQQQHESQVLSPNSLLQPPTPSLLPTTSIPPDFVDQWNQFNEDNDEIVQSDNEPSNIIEVDQLEDNVNVSGDPTENINNNTDSTQQPISEIIEEEKDASENYKQSFEEFVEPTRYRREGNNSRPS